MTYGRLTATGRSELRLRPDGRNRRYHEWRCTCGELIWQAHYVVASGNTSSCGCLHREAVSAPRGAGQRGIRRSHTLRPTWDGHSLIPTVAERNHGQSKTRIYQRWKAIHTRCYNVNFPNYRFYGERGIRVCDAWQDFFAFKAWAEVNGWSEDTRLELDRIDPDGDYSPDNCRWIDKRANILRARRGLGRLGLPDDIELRLRERALVDRVDVTQLIEQAVVAFLAPRA